MRNEDKKAKPTKPKKSQFEEDQYVTKGDFRELKADMRAFRTDLKTDMLSFKNEIKDELKSVKSEFRWIMGIGLTIIILLISASSSILGILVSQLVK